MKTNKWANRRSSQLLLFAAVSLMAVLALVMGNMGYMLQPLFSIPTADGAPSGFVTRFGSELMLNRRPFRFAGANMHWLALDDSTNYPSQFRMDDGLDAAKEMGATVVRSIDLGISIGCSNCIEPSLGVFNETAFAHVDYAIKAARDRGIRLIIVLTHEPS